MRIKSVIAGAVAAVSLGIVPLALANGLPEDQSVYYYIHDNPTQATSNVVFTIRLDLTAADSDGDAVGWEITAIEFRQVGARPTLDTLWSDTSPTVDSPDGLWWVEHSDAAFPALEEFTLPPKLLGLAIGQDPLDKNLDYDLKGVAYVPPLEGAPFEITGALTYVFTEEEEEDPVEQGKDEPIELPPDIPNGVEDPD